MISRRSAQRIHKTPRSTRSGTKPLKSEREVAKNLQSCTARPARAPYDPNRGTGGASVGRSRRAQRMRKRRLVRRLRAGVVVFAVIAALGVGWQPASPVSSALRRYPYVSEVVGNSATLNWATDRSQTTGTAKWGAVVNGQCAGTVELGDRDQSVDHGRFNARVPVDRSAQLPEPRHILLPRAARFGGPSRHRRVTTRHDRRDRRDRRSRSRCSAISVPGPPTRRT